MRQKSMLFREVNERIAELLARSWPTAPGDFLCECGGDACSRRVTIQLDDYRTLRSRGALLLAQECGRGTRRPWRRGSSGRLAASA